MSTDELELVMTPDGIKKRVITPRDEMPEVIVYQGVEYFPANEAVPQEMKCIGDLGFGLSRTRWCCGICGKFLSNSRPSEGTSCPRCKTKVVYEDDSQHW